MGYLQFGSDVEKLREGLEFLCHELGKTNRRQKLKVVGSVMLPSKMLLARFRFRPWAGMVLSEEFLHDVETADAIVRDILRVYREYNVEPLLETAIRSEKDALYAEELFHQQDDFGTLSKRWDATDVSSAGESLPEKLEVHRPVKRQKIKSSE